MSAHTDLGTARIAPGVIRADAAGTPVTLRTALGAVTVTGSRG
ncbi:MAG TPA: hypothetical protein VNJ51_11650 [Candidatus Dormibacteraeota bacterium]|nr:hypothetical protein [Candidatus Dormibacteraeota bacterium]